MYYLLRSLYQTSNRTKTSGPIWWLLHTDIIKQLFSAELFTFAWLIFYWQCDEWWKMAFQKENQKSKPDMSLNIRWISDLQKKCQIPTTFRFEFKLLHIPILWTRKLVINTVCWSVGELVDPSEQTTDDDNCWCQQCVCRYCGAMSWRLLYSGTVAILMWSAVKLTASGECIEKVSNDQTFWLRSNRPKEQLADTPVPYLGLHPTAHIRQDTAHFPSC